MKKLMALIATVLMMTATSYAQYDYGYEPPPTAVSLTISPQLTIPLGDFADAYKLGYGGSVTIGFQFVPMAEATVTSGYHWIGGEDLDNGDKVDNASIIPIMGGLRFLPAPNLYLGAEAGVHGFDGNTEFNPNGTLDATNDTRWKFAVSPMVGFKSTVGGVGADVNAMYTWTEDYEYIGARLGFTVGTW